MKSTPVSPLEERQLTLLESAEPLLEWEHTPPRVITLVPFCPALVGFVAAVAVLGRDSSDLGYAFGLFSFCSLISIFLWFTACAPWTYKAQLTSVGIRQTWHENVAEGFYTGVRIFAVVGVIACIVAASIIGPGAFVGAGAFALMAPMFLGMGRAVKSHNAPIFKEAKIMYHPETCTLHGDFIIPDARDRVLPSYIETYITPEEFEIFMQHINRIVDVCEYEESDEKLIITY